MNTLVVAAGFGLVTAGVVAVTAVGATLQFGVTKYINFALGDYMTVGAYTMWLLSERYSVNLWIALLVGGLAVGAMAVLISRVLFAPFVRRKASPFIMLIVTFGLSLVLSNVLTILFGTDVLQFSNPLVVQKAVQIGPLLATPVQIGVVVVAVLLMVGIQQLLIRTSIGKAMRAMSDNSDLARVSGIDTIRMTDWVWFISGGLAGIGGALLALDVGEITPTFGEAFLFVVFAAVVVGGAGQAYGAMLGALIVGLTTSLGSIVVGSAYQNDLAFVILILALAIRPRGIIPSRASGL